MTCLAPLLAVVPALATPGVTSLIEVALLNLVLSGDNAVVIGLAARGLPPPQARRAIMLGGGAAVALRIALTLPAEMLLRVPMLRAGGGLLLAWVAYRLLTGEEEAATDHGTLSTATAIRLIVVADATMSLDNVLAVAAVAERSTAPELVLAIGIGLSVPIVLLGGGLVARLMARLPVLVWLGAAVLTYTAAELIAKDHAVDHLWKVPTAAILAFAALLTAAVLGLAWRSIRRAKVSATAASQPSTSTATAPMEEVAARR
jgi:YjbE family integral membrane protein